MRKYLTTALAIALMSGTSFADLQNVEVNGSLRIRGNSFQSVDSEKANSTNQSTEQRTTVGIAADFSDDVSANITLSRYNVWGSDGVNDDADVRMHEAYISLGEAVAGFDLKIGRQEVILGSEFLLGNNNTAGGFDNISFDGIVATYSNDTYDVTLLNLKVSETDANTDTAVDTDTDLYGIYGTYNGIENHTIDGYVLVLRTGQTGDNDELTTIGARATGSFGGAFDYELEVATQTGDDGSGSATEDYEGTAINADLGYTFDANYQPRVFVGVASFSGDDADGMGFDRLYSDWEYSEFLADGDMTNVLIIRAGVSANVTEKIGLSAVVSSFELDEEGSGYTTGTNLNDGADDELGTEIGLYATYQYSEDVSVEVGAAQFMNGDSIEAAATNEDDQTYVYAEISLSF